jgi:hypothetical protein
VFFKNLAVIAGQLFILSCARAAPITPAIKTEIVERLPGRANPAFRRVDSLRKQLAARPDDSRLRKEIARRYVDMVMATRV